MSVYSYTRTSQIECLESLQELETILEKEDLRLQTYALGEGMKVNERFIDENQRWNVSLAKRPQGRELLKRLETGDILLVCTLERIFSNCDDMVNTLQELKKRNVKLIVVDLDGDVTDADMTPQFNDVLKVFHSLEKRRSTERIKTVKQSQRKKGRFLGGSRPFGYMIHSNGRLIENPMEQRVLKKILEMKKLGKSLRAISAEVSTPMMPVSFKTVQRLIKRHETELSSRQSSP
ncbi:MAG: recombinase family protein [Gammaproteobacteria bacterium]|nr:recombinase family protein [Gammaproteobacteria bacterium]